MLGTSRVVASGIGRLGAAGKSVRLVVSNIDELRKVLPVKMQKCLSFFPGVDRTVGGYEGLVAAQQCLPNNEVRDKFAAEYTILGNIWEALSPDACLEEFKDTYRWLTAGFVKMCRSKITLITGACWKR